MMRPRIIPILLLNGAGLVKTTEFANPKYIGDPINAVKIFNDKEVDELILLDIHPNTKQAGPNFGKLKEIAGECFMPLSYGGGINSVEMARELLGIGIEKVILNTAAYTDPRLVPELAARFGSSTIVGSIDVRRSWLGKEAVYINNGSDKIPLSPVEWAAELQRRGVGEIVINAVSRDGTMSGYDLDLVKRVAKAVSLPVVAAGGGRDLADFKAAVQTSGASAVAAGAMFVFHGRHRAVLITYPTEAETADLWRE